MAYKYCFESEEINEMKTNIYLMGALLIAVLIASCGSSEQISDKKYNPVINSPAYETGRGPVVCVDESHNNFHTLNDRFWAFGELLRRDGYVVVSNKEKFGVNVLKRCAILVIANAQLESDDWDGYPYPTPSAFTDEEIEAVQSWVQGGGALLLIADHMPLAGVAQKLALAFDIRFNNGFAVEGYQDESERDAAFQAPTIFQLEDHTLSLHAITNGRTADEAITSIRTFNGQSFQAPDSAQPLLILPSNFISLMPEKAWQFDSDTKRIPVGGWLQGAVMPFGSGRTAFFGEAAMFTAQLIEPGGERLGMNAPQAEQNFQFILNLMHWLSGTLN